MRTFRRFVVVSLWQLSRKTSLIKRIVLNGVILSYVNPLVPMSSILMRRVQGVRLLEDLSCITMVVKGSSGPISGPSAEAMRLIEDALRTTAVRSPGVRAGTILAQIVS